MPERCCRPSRRSSERSKLRAAPGTSAAYCLTAPKTTGSTASSSPLPISPSGGTRRAAGGGPRRTEGRGSAAKSRFLAGASHDLRQPLQTLALLQGLLARTVEGDRAQKLVTRLDETMGAISGMLNTLLDINQIEAGTVHAEKVSFPVDALFDRLRDEFTYPAQSKRL